jgi:hypothetical protein
MNDPTLKRLIMFGMIGAVILAAFVSAVIERLNAGSTGGSGGNYGSY